MMKYEVENRNYGSTWIKVIGENAKRETMVIEIVHCENPGGNNSLPYLWHKNGYIDKIMKTYIGCNTYVTDSEGNCFGKYNVTSKMSEDGMRNVIDFDWLLEDTEENRKKIIEKCVELFENAKGKSATEEKIDHVKKYAKAEGLEVVDKLPEGWTAKRYFTDPLGSISIVNGSPLIKVFGKVKKNPSYKRMLMIV